MPTCSCTSWMRPIPIPEQIAEVEKVLGEIGAGEIPQVLVFNKLDAVPADQQPLAMQDTYEWDGRQLPKLFVSARTGQGLPELRIQLTAAALAARESPMTPGADAEFPAP